MYRGLTKFLTLMLLESLDWFKGSLVSFGPKPTVDSLIFPPSRKSRIPQSIKRKYCLWVLLMVDGKHSIFNRLITSRKNIHRIGIIFVVIVIWVVMVVIISRIAHAGVASYSSSGHRES
ncbi:hypothetical protein ASPBRDRAFT_371962 [Aspergillus brasiliensis CBS 101740]|uniref:Transmembrane protein n=1 Tax=Aspergillus brasiliensis (strain CBS 101740 / IMI 381727 / IBT 21946) TaxID=767769 RepID=A0A1L9UUV1_ASPBC|nr:hypothetical protein ASPBRDRAFT_371962 [Aspergillus brasiliensis CBS 101740]